MRWITKGTPNGEGHGEVTERSRAERRIWATGILAVVVYLALLWAVIFLWDAPSTIRVLFVAIAAPVGWLVRYITQNRLKRVRALY